MTIFVVGCVDGLWKILVIRAKAGIPLPLGAQKKTGIPAFAGMTKMYGAASHPP